MIGKIISSSLSSIIRKPQTQRIFLTIPRAVHSAHLTNSVRFAFCACSSQKQQTQSTCSSKQNSSCETPANPVGATTVIQHPDFYIEQHFTSCLAHYAYYIESKGEAIIIDPLRETKPYLEIAARRNTKIKYILESHFHADFVSGHISLQKQTGAQIVYGPSAVAQYQIYVAQDGEHLSFGNAQIEVLHTPGHTMESSCFLLKDSKGTAHSVYTGDTIFLGDVGRPDLAVKSGSITVQDLAGLLFESITSKILPLADNVIVFPSHGAGSACGKNISKGHMCDIKGQKERNYAFQKMTKEQFINIVANGLPQPPKYFFHDAVMNKTGYATLEDVTIQNFTAIKGSEVQAVLGQSGATILDSRTCINDGFLEGSINIPLNVPFAVWVGTLIDAKTPLVILTDKGTEEEVAKRLMRIGFDKILGYIEGGFEAVKGQTQLKVIQAKQHNDKEFVKIVKNKDNFVLDVRTLLETEKGFLQDAQIIPLAELTANLSKLPKDKQIYVYCQSGARSKMAVTLLELHGISNVEIAKNGYNALAKEFLAL